MGASVEAEAPVDEGADEGGRNFFGPGDGAGPVVPVRSEVRPDALTWERYRPSTATLLRRQGSIAAFVGSNGSGKTLAAVETCLESLRRGRPVWSTVPLLHPVTGEEHPLYRPLSSWAQLLSLSDCDVLLDEVATVASARQSQALPHALEVVLQQLRKRDLRVLWTAPDWRRPDVILRQVTLHVTYCRGFLAKGNGSGWPDRRLFRWITYPASDFEDFTQGVRERLDRLTAEWYWRPGRLAQWSYRSLDSVGIIVDDISDAGRCGHCGGYRSRPKCSCDAHKPRRASGARDAATGRGASA